MPMSPCFKPDFYLTTLSPSVWGRTSAANHIWWDEVHLLALDVPVQASAKCCKSIFNLLLQLSKWCKDVAVPTCCVCADCACNLLHLFLLVSLFFLYFIFLCLWMNISQREFWSVLLYRFTSVSQPTVYSADQLMALKLVGVATWTEAVPAETLRRTQRMKKAMGKDSWCVEKIHITSLLSCNEQTVITVIDELALLTWRC